MAEISICLIERCDNNIHARGWCLKHYRRFQRHGSPLCTKSRHRNSTDPLPEEKACAACGELKPVADFSVRPDRPSGLRSNCKPCVRGKTAKYKANNPEKVAAYLAASKQGAAARSRAWRAENKERDLNNSRANRDVNREKIRAQERERHARNPNRRREQRRLARLQKPDEVREKERLYRDANRDAVRERSRKSCAKRRSSPNGKLENAIRARLHKELVRGSKNGKKTFDLLGYTASELRAHLERQFAQGMNWDNYGAKGWHIDHILPVSSFQFETSADPAFRACWALTNLRPLWAKENMSKGPKRLLLI